MRVTKIRDFVRQWPLFPLILLLLYGVSFLLGSFEQERKYRGIRYRVNRFSGDITEVYYPFFGWVKKERLKNILAMNKENRRIAREKMLTRLGLPYPDKPEQVKSYKKIWNKIKQEDDDYRRLVELASP